MTLTELFVQQQTTGAEIQRIVSNYRKDPNSRKTLEYLQRRLANLDTLWEDFDSTDNKIRTTYGSQLDHQYFSTGYFESIREGFEKTRNNIIEGINILKTASQSQEGVQVSQLPHSRDSSPPASEEGTRDPPGVHNYAVNAACKGAISKHSAIAGAQGAPTNSDTVTQLIRKQQIIIKALQRALLGVTFTEDQQSQQFYHLKLKTIERHWHEVEQLHRNIWEQVNDPLAEGYDVEQFFTLEDETQSKVVYLHERMTQLSAQSHNSTAMIENPRSNSTQIMMKLPKVALPKFDGDYLRWRQFRDLFTELIHSQPIADCQKMWYLKTSLSGEAENLIRHFTISEANYNAAWKVVNERYENTRLLVTATLNKLLSQSSAINESSTAIKSLHDTTQECLLSLQNLGIDTTHWDPLLLHILLKKLDRATHALWEQALKQPRSLQSMKDFLSFLETRFQSLEVLGHKTKSLDEPHRKKYVSSKVLASTNASGSCIICNGNHQLYACQKFLQLSPVKRLNAVKGAKRCINCLGSGHNTNNCPARTCTKCSKRHNTLLHFDTTEPVTAINQAQSKQSSNDSHTRTSGASYSSSTQRGEQLASLTTKTTSRKASYVLLSTVLVKIMSKSGSFVECRAILDSGSQLNFVTDRLVRKLGLKESRDKMRIEGIGQGRQQTQRRVNIQLHSRINEFSTRIEAHVLPQIISPQPSQLIDASSWEIPQNIQLGDPEFNKPQSIDVLIGAEIFYSVLAVGQVKLKHGLPTLQNTVFGWTISGKAPRDVSHAITASCGICSEDESLNQQIEKFWKLEETEGTSNNLTAAERRCENHFIQTSKRDSKGRFVVRLPFSDDPNKLGESKEIAIQRLKALERKLSRNHELRNQYMNFMQEYSKLGHMREVSLTKIEKPCYFLPHHCILKPHSSTTKLRVVFDASAKTSSNISLNDILCTGPTIQDDVFSILLRFRMPKFVFTADIEKMYRQVLVHENDRRYQLILWRNDPQEALRYFELCTLTYGTTSASYLAIKCLQKLATDGASKYPLGAQVLKRDFYVDDVLTGSDSLPTLLATQEQLNSLLQAAGFKLRKWCANHPRLLENIPNADQEVQLDFNSKAEENIKTMGLTWLPKTDNFVIRGSWLQDRKITKRTALSDVAHLFDPLGIMAPVVIIAKIFLQKLWKLKLDWDAALPQDLHYTWAKFREGLNILNEIKFPRHVFSQKTPIEFQVHIFADASEKAYGAAAYVRSINKDTIVVRLLCAKSRVAPVKQITLPRLELCAAKLAAELSQRIRSDLNLKNETIFLWSDSEIVLAWINSASSSFHTFVANRVSAIQQLTIPQQWRHVGSKDNPADILSRGIAPERLAANNLWFYGPTFLHGSESLWPQIYKADKECLVERRERTSTTLAATQVHSHEHFVMRIDHRNSFRHAQRVIGYMLRFIKNTRYPEQRKGNVTLTMDELDEASNAIIKTMQQQELSDDIIHLRRYGEVQRNSSLSSLAPLIDQNGIIRVGGRLQASNLPYHTKHPILLPYAHPFTKMLLADLHKQNLHAGPQALLAIARQKFWPIKGKTLTRSVVQHCVFCSRAKPRLMSQLMGNLPAHRVQPARPFVNSGVDFCGPIWTHFKVRGKRPQKAYIAVFCCFATKAVHMEIVSDLSAEGFIGALKRFMARRGHCRNIYCDNATNFIGARNQLQEVKQMLDSNNSKERIARECSRKGTEFHMIPPRAPHFGGLWEAAVKSAKHLLQGSLASANLTYEEMETVIVEAEAILNSRPITPLSEDPNDFTALTPGHLLIGEPIVASTDVNAEPLKVNLLARWRLVSHIKNEFWRRWVNEYLGQLQHRYKWKQRVANVKPGTMVILKEDNLPPLKWPLGRIVRTIAGEDGLVRVVDVRTKNSILRRSVPSLAPLPIDDSQHTSEISTSSQDDSPTHDDHGQGTSQDPDQRPRKRIRSSLGSTLITTLLACLVLPFAYSAPLEVSKFTSNPGIYFENLGVANMIASEWNLITYYDMQPFWKEYDMLVKCSQTLRSTCTALKENGSCRTIIDQFEHITNELTRNNQLLLPTEELPRKGRKTRGAVNFIGNMANALFGVLDSDYAQGMSETIGKIGQNEEHLSMLLKNQTSILDATVNIIQRDQEVIEKQFQLLQTRVNEVANQVNGVHEEMHQQKLSQFFSSLALQAIIAATNFLRIQQSILDILISTHHGNVSPQLITPMQLTQQLITIKGNLPSTIKLPVTDNDILKFYKLITIEGRPTTRHIIFKLKLPLLAPEDFELFSAVPVPVKTNGTYVAIHPSFPFLIVNLHRDQYYTLTEPELQSCLSISEDRHLCKQKHPMHRRGSSVSRCEIDLLNHLTNVSSCQVMKVGPGPHWSQLCNPNQWIYALEEKTTINVVCNDNLSQFTIEGSGILKIESNCIIKQQLTTIQGHSIYPASLRTSYVPTMNLTETIASHPIATASYQYPPLLLHADELESIKKRLAELHTELPNMTHSYDAHHFAVGYLSLALISTVIIAAIWRFRCHRTQTKKCKPIPNPRRANDRNKEETKDLDFSVNFDRESS